MMKSRLVWLIVIIIFGSIISQCSSANRNDAGLITKSGDLDVQETKVGDCFADVPNVTDSAVDISSLKAVPCSDPHSWQIFHKSNISFEDYSKSAVTDASSEICDVAAEALFQSLSYAKINEHRLSDLNVIQPTSDGWAKGNKVVDCLIGSDTEIYYSSILD